ncbi:MAG: 4-hydroxy-3-methylbut-2-enyl diphosphate reductase [Planctomycetota bacterium]|nr:4-hydroxy-3-methylbut-2-enyl diphosphate reductase [Planctomycetota bacterium]
MPKDRIEPTTETARLESFSSCVVDRLRAAGGVWSLRSGEILLPRVFGFCRGVKRALAMLEQAVGDRRRPGERLVLLGEIIHNPWVNEFFRRRNVRILTRQEAAEPEKHVGQADWAIIPAFGVPLLVERRLRTIGCKIVDTSCGDVRRLWRWAECAVRSGYGILIFGRADHDETVVTKSRLAAANGRYLVLGSLDEIHIFCEMIVSEHCNERFRQVFDTGATNAEAIDPLCRLAQVSQTTMLYDDTMEVRRLLRQAFARRFGSPGAEKRLLFHPTVCRATQDRQAAAVELCRKNLDLVIVVGGFGSSNTRHLYELAQHYARSLLIEDAEAIRSESQLATIDLARNEPLVVRNWLPRRRPLRIGVLAGASCPEVVVGQVLQRLATWLA